MKADIIVKSIIFNRNLGKVLLIQRSGNDPTGANTWENAGGNIEYGEIPEEAMKREIMEETGIAEITIDRVAYVTLVNAEEPYLIIAYLCEAQTEIVTLSNEHQAFIWADKDECRNMLPKAILDDFEKHKIFEYICDIKNQI
ncbi:MAG: NUDIX domain-containing protein [Oscillospiraceae bacterium]|nr:NUDIX domain-containing protein [Oscillospiraceae bacterium]